MGLDPELLEILICPDCHGEVEYKERRKVILCNGCGLQYPVRDGIPVMLVEEAKGPGRRAKSEP